jgi:hypothetical protein
VSSVGEAFEILQIRGIERSAPRAGRDLKKENAVRQANRRAQGMVPRSEWLKVHSAPPWVGSGLSKSAWYRKQRAGKDMAE